jgi:hypothetical protein
MLLLTLGSLLVVTAWARPAPASADLIWCWDDPTVAINGNAVHIRVGVPADGRQERISMALTLRVPANVQAHLSGAAARSFPYDLTLSHDGPYSGSGPIPVTIVVVVAGPPDMPAALHIWQSSVGALGEVRGTAGVPMVSTIAVQ